MIGVTPTFETAGVFAAIMLLAARLIQGLAYGGEMPTAPDLQRRWLPRSAAASWSSMIYVSGTIGACLGIFMGVIMNLFLSPRRMSEWGWRVPFFIGALGGLWALVGLQLHESETFKSNKASAPRSGPKFPPQLEVRIPCDRPDHRRHRVLRVWSVSAVQQAVVVHVACPRPPRSTRASWPTWYSSSPCRSQGASSPTLVAAHTDHQQRLFRWRCCSSP